MIQITIDTSTDTRSLEIMAEMLKAMAAARDLRQKYEVNARPVKQPIPQGEFESEPGPRVCTAAADESFVVQVTRTEPDYVDESLDFHNVSATVCETELPETYADDKGAQYDANNLPWDERIHSSNRAKNADGTWRRRRGVDDVRFELIMDELRGEVAPSEAPKPQSESATVAHSKAPTAIVPPSLFAPPPPPPAAPNAPEVVPSAIFAETSAPAVVPSSGVVNFATLVDFIVKNKVDAATVTAACSAEGVASLAVLGAQPDKVAAVAKRLGL